MFVFFFVKSTLPRYNFTLPRTRGKLNYNCKKIKSKFAHITMYLNVKCIQTFLVVLTPKISLKHKNNHIRNIHTLGDT